MQDKNTTRYFMELQRRLTKEGIQALPPAEDRLAIMLDSQEVGVAIPTGGMRYR